MKLRITIDIFSGRPNPVIELEAEEAQEALARLRPARRLKDGEPGLPPEPTLGYRGLIIEQLEGRNRKLPRVFRLAHGDLFGPSLAHKAEDEDFEDFVCGSTGLITRLGLKKDFAPRLKKEILQFKELRKGYEVGEIVWPPRPICIHGPIYEPTWWNDGGQKQFHNNCYNYATNYRTDTFGMIPGGSQPGAAAGAMYTSITCAAVTAAAVADGLDDCPTADNKCPAEGHLVALVIAPGWDFHWYRKGRNNKWSHKPGSTAVVARDNAGALISDPRVAQRGPYTEFATFMVVMHGHIKIK